MNSRNRPGLATTFSVLLVTSACFMIYLGTMAAAYYVPAVCLLLAAVLLWRGSKFKWFARLLIVNQVTAVVLLLALWLGDALHLPKLDITAAMLIGNFITGGPLLGILAIPLMAFLHFGKTLPAWFGSQDA